MPVEVARADDAAVEEFLRGTQREALRTLYGFNVVWFEQKIEFAARDGTAIVAAARILVAASLTHVVTVVVTPERRGEGIGKRLLAEAAEVAGYNNCHKMSALVPYRSAAQAFLEACDYKEEAVLRQHTFKLDVAVMRKFLL